tara:strand:- start:74076 stop:74693 length:618 start_codon:yes stop_codon:yes gene_type:complete
MLESVLRSSRILPVITARSVESTVQLAAALQRGGMHAVEITLRSEVALDSLRAVSAAFPDMHVAAGTVTNEVELDQAVEAGASLVLSPGATDGLLAAARERRVDIVPGVATASEIMRGLDYGLTIFKLFPAEAAGGLALLRSLAGPFPNVQFCPTGGLNPDNFRTYLAQTNVICCGGSWMVTPELVDNERWHEIEALAMEAMAIF